MTEQQAEHILAEALEAYHRQKARGESPDEVAYRDRLGDLYPDFVELIAAETLIDQALEPPGDEIEGPTAWGPYTLLSKIASGGAGVVYRAMHRRLGRTVALKMLRTGPDTDSTTRERFLREAQALAQVKHENIVEIYEFGENDGRPYYAMNLVDGPSLSELSQQGPHPDPRELCRGLAEIADALMTLHGQGIVHRDVKPGNIIRDKDGRYVLADFGLARTNLASTLTHSGDSIGTPYYMSPEQMLGDRKAVDERTDVYGLGTVLYQMLTGRRPFETDSLATLMRLVIKERPEDPRSLVPDLPRGCASIAMTCLEKESDDRYESAAKLKHDLLTFAEGGAPLRKPVGRTRRGLRLLRRHPILTAAAALLLAFGVYWVSRPEPDVQLTITAKMAARMKVAGVHADYLDAAKRLQVPVRPHTEVRVFVDIVDENFQDQELTIPVSTGTHTTDVPRIPRTQAGIDMLLEEDGVVIKEPALSKDGGEKSRGDGNDLLEPWFPRGPTRLADMGRWHVYAGMALGKKYPKGAWLAFYVDEQLIHEQPYPIPEDRYEDRGAIPASVLTKLKVGDVVTWGLAPAQGERPLQETAATATVVEDRVAQTLAKIDQVVGDAAVEDRESVRARMRAKVFLNAGLPAAAWEALQPVIDADMLAWRSYDDIVGNPQDRLADAEDALADAERSKDAQAIRKATQDVADARKALAAARKTQAEHVLPGLRSTPEMLAWKHEALIGAFGPRADRGETTAWVEFLYREQPNLEAFRKQRAERSSPGGR